MANIPWICYFVIFVNMIIFPPSHRAILIELINKYYMNNCYLSLRSYDMNGYTWFHEPNTYVFDRVFFFWVAFSPRWTSGFSLVQAPNSWIVQCINKKKKLCFAFNCSVRGRLILLSLIIVTEEMFCHVFRACCRQKAATNVCTVRFVNVVLQHNKFIWKKYSFLFFLCKNKKKVTLNMVHFII